MSILATTLAKIKSHQPLTAIIGNNSFVDVAPQDLKTPHVLFYSTYEDAEDCLVEFETFQSVTLRFESIAPTREIAEEAAIATEAALNGFRGRLDGDTIFVNGVKRATGRIHLVDSPQDGTDHWTFRTIQNFDINYHFV